jgi:3-dehydroquinate synthase
MISDVNTVNVALGDRAYSIHVGRGARKRIPEFLPSEPVQCVVIADRTVADLHLATLRAALPTPPLVITFPSGEESKSLATVEHLCDQLAEARIERSAVILAFGGGVAGDLAGFVAASWLRGVRFLQVPTTLLAAVDASVGGKTGVNLAAGKNLVGAFHQPIGVVIDTDFLATLPQREFAGGLAECVKHAAIRAPELLGWYESNAGALDASHPDRVAELIARNCAIKAEIVAADEREVGVRAFLNYGHTLGHAFEKLLDYELRHGECVGLGTIAENHIAQARGWLPAADGERLRVLLADLGLPVKLPRALAAEDVWAACQVDKKVRGGSVNFVLLEALGRPVRVADVTAEEVAAALAVVA